MTQKHKIQLFEEKKARTVWDDEKEEWYFSIVDVCAVLTESENPQMYWRVLKNRLKKEGNESVTNCNALKMQAADGKLRLTDVDDTEQLFRLIQSIPSPKAEPNTNENENEKWRKRETFETIKFGRMRWSIAPRYISRLTRCLGLRRKAFATNFSVPQSV